MATSSPPAPPPPPPVPSKTMGLKAEGSTQEPQHCIFKINGEKSDEIVFEFCEVANAPNSVPLKAIVRQLVSSPHLRSVPAKNLYMVLGRLRCLHYSICEYNKGAASSSPSQMFLRYWRRRTLNLLSGFGFQATNSQQLIVVAGLEELIAKIEEIYRDEIQSANDIIKSGTIIFDALGELYRPFSPVKGRTSLAGTPGIFMVVDYFFEERRALMGLEKSFHFTMDFIASFGDHFCLVTFTEVLSGWTGVRTRPMSELTYVPLESAELDPLIRRGRQYVDFTTGGAKFLAYGPNTFSMHGSQKAAAGGGGGASLSRSGGSLLPAGGRIMVDAVRGAQLGHHASQGYDEPTSAMIQLSGRYRRWVGSQSAGPAGGAAVAHEEALTAWDGIPDELLHYCWPALVGFSFTAKVWGHVLVSGLQPIHFQADAFDQLVLAVERKQLIRALVKFGGAGDTDDIVAGKRGGSVFLLHGPPGVGKTLTAEAMAETLRRPLYYVSMGELGMTPEDIERRLGDVLELCAAWGALTLLDEADVFLEARTTSDLVRNAMVCVMLRLVEYHPGLLFLTTNRVRAFDPAFESRVTVALRYDPLPPAARAQVWRNLLARVAAPPAVGGDVSCEALGRHELNGRQIKNAVRLAAALARERGCEVTQEVLETTLRITSIGREEMRLDDSWKGS